MAELLLEVESGTESRRILSLNTGQVNEKLLIGLLAW